MKTESLFVQRRPLILGAILLLLSLASLSESKAAAVDNAKVAFKSCRSLLKSEPAERLEFVDQVVEAQLPEMMKLFSEIVKKYPMAESEYVFVGRSPTLLAAYLDVQKSMYPDLRSWTLPLSLKSEVEVSRATLDKRFLEAVRKFRTKDVSPLRRLVFIDFVSKGRTFMALDRLIGDAGMHGAFVGFAHDVAGAKDVFKKSYMTSPVDIFPVSEDVEFNLMQMKYLAAYPSLEIEKADFIDADMRPGIKSPLYEATLRSVSYEIFGE